MLDQEDHVKTGVFSYDKVSKPYRVSGNDLAVLGIKKMAWQVGEKIRVTTEQPASYVWVQLDETLAPTLVYLADTKWTYTIPAEKCTVDTAFESHRHYLMVRTAMPAEIGAYQNLALNPHDQRATSTAYPHVFTNVTDEPDPVFWPQNAVDGKLANISHGSYPYGSWGIHEHANATLTIDFGRVVKLTTVRLLFRHDHLERVHDGYWDHVTLAFSNGDERTFETDDCADFQTLTFEPQLTDKLILKDLHKAPNSARFVALTQIEAYGYNQL
ncbi:hypothetical protein D1831_12555 [Lactiplantibacillus garii]|uniref:Carbohydrate-binding protein n=1 Tax=Lactiplantibacillus garii TaxID=2306423 RepID=A0A426D4F8_9LACO|nr:hypothetical protein D1831_12555 [Lactiplantibacillus garii]